MSRRIPKHRDFEEGTINPYGAEDDDLRREQLRRQRMAQKRARMIRERKRRKRKKILTLVLFAVIFVAVITGIVLLIKNLAVIPEVSNLEITSTTSEVSLKWKRSKDNLSYEVYKKTAEDADYQLITTIPEAAETSYTDSNLPSATLFEYKVLACKGKGDKVKKTEGKQVSIYTVPVTPSECSAVTQSKNSLTVTFADTQKPDTYEIKCGTEESLTDASVTAVALSDTAFNSETGQHSFIFNDLVEGSTYFFSIRALAGTDAYSEWSNTFSGKVTRAIDMTGIDINRPMVALTYDDGPAPGDITERIINAIESGGGHATFFQLGDRAEGYPDQMQRMASGGHEIGCHTYDHSHMGEEVTPDDIIRANDAIEQSSGIRPSVFRSPGGGTTDTIRSVCVSEGMSLYYWSVDTRDWSSRNADSVVSEIQNNTSDGDIILMHNIYDSTAEATERIVPWLVEQGYQLVTVSQLIQAKTGEPPVPGVQYYTATRTD